MGITWTEVYAKYCVIYSPKNWNVFCALNFKISISHLTTLCFAAVCVLVPELAPEGAVIYGGILAGSRAMAGIFGWLLPELL